MVGKAEQTQTATHTVAWHKLEASLYNLTRHRNDEGDLHFPRRVSALQSAPGHSRVSRGAVEKSEPWMGTTSVSAARPGPYIAISVCSVVFLGLNTAYKG